MCAQGPPSYSKLETNDRRRLRREAALAQVSQGATYCVHYSSLREILNSQALADRIARYPEGGLTHIEYLHQVPADTPHPCSKRITFPHTFELTKPEPQKKPRYVRKPKPRKPRLPKWTVEEQIATRQEYERARNQTPERKEFQRLQAQKARQDRQAAGLCKTFSNSAIPGLTRPGR